MNKHFRRIAAALLVALLLASCLLGLSGCSLVELNEERRQAQVIARVGDTVITVGEYETAFINYLYNSGMIYYLSYLDEATLTNYKDNVVSSLIEEQVKKLKATDLGLMEYKPEEDDARADKAYQENMDALLESFVEEVQEEQATLISDKTDELTTKWEEAAKEQTDIDVDAKVTEELEAWQKDAEEILSEDEIKAEAQTRYDDYLKDYDQNYGLEKYKEELLKTATQERAFEELEEMFTKDITVTDDEVRAQFDQLVKDQTAAYAEKLTDFETAMNAYWTDSSSQIIAYQPEGYRTVKQILISIPDDKQTEIADLRNEDKATEADALLAAELAKIQAKADGILAEVKAEGADFDALMEKYNEDPGLQEEPAKTHGYLVSTETSFVTSFKDAALALQNKGDVTDLIASDYGYHIIYLVDFITPGAVAYDDAMKATVQEDLLKTKKQTSYAETYQSWREDEYKTKVYQSLYTKYPEM